MSGDIMNTAEAADLLGLSVATLKKWRRDGEGPNWFRITPSPTAHVRYTRDAIDAWIEDEHKRAFSERHERKDGGMG